jgi:hypothetical protein
VLEYPSGGDAGGDPKRTRRMSGMWKAKDSIGILRTTTRLLATAFEGHWPGRDREVRCCVHGLSVMASTDTRSAGSQQASCRASGCYLISLAQRRSMCSRACGSIGRAPGACRDERTLDASYGVVAEQYDDRARHRNEEAVEV